MKALAILVSPLWTGAQKRIPRASTTQLDADVTDSVDSIDTVSSTPEESSIVQSGSEVETDTSHAEANPWEGAGHVTLSHQVQAVREANTVGAQQLAHAIAENNPAHVQEVLGLAPWLLNAPLPNGYTPLMQASAKGRVDIVRCLLEQEGIDPNLVDGDRYGALQHAAALGDTDVITCLLQHPKTHVNPQSASACSALVIAVMHDQVAAAELLLARGADIHWRDTNGASILDACLEAKASTARWLLKRPQLREHKGQTLSLQSLLRQPDREGATLLHHAANAGHVKWVEVLLEHGADPLEGDSDGWLPLQYAIHQGHLKVTQRLLPLRLLGIDATTSTGRTLIHEALGAGRLAVAKWLMQQGAGLERVSDDGSTLWHAVVEADNGALAARWLHKTLRRRPARSRPDVNQRDANGATPLLLAVRKNAMPIVGVLLKQPGIDPNAADDEGWAPLHHAARQGAADSLIQLLAHPDIDLLQRGPEGKTFLHLIACRGHRLPLLLNVRERLSSDQFQTLKDARDDFDACPASTAAEYGARDEVLALLRPSAVATRLAFTATNFKRGWIVEGEGLGQRHAWARHGKSAGIEMHTVGDGDGDETLTFQKLKRLDIRPGDFVIVSGHCSWNDDLKRLEITLSPGVRAPLVEIARLLLEKDVLKALFVGCLANMAMTALRNRFTRDPMIVYPEKGPTPLEGLDITIVGRKDLVSTVLDDRTVTLWLQDCAAGRRHTQQRDGAAFNRSVQPMRTLGWDASEGRVSVTSRYRLKAHQLDHLLPAQVGAVKEELLLLSAFDGRIREVTTLLDRHQVHPDAHTGNGVTPLMLACRRGRPRIIQLLLQHHASVHLVDIDGRSALWRACEEGFAESTKILLAAGADPHVRDVDGISPWDVARSRQHAAILKLLPPPPSHRVASAHPPDG